MMEIVNRQRRRRLNLQQLRRFAAEALRAIERDDREATVVLVSDRTIRKLNQQFRGRDYATDVLSFPFRPEPFEAEASIQLGEIVISVDRAVEQARSNQLSLTNEIEQLILHGLLHLCGYDHETDKGEMNRLELRLRKKLGVG